MAKTNQAGLPANPGRVEIDLKSSAKVELRTSRPADMSRPEVVTWLGKAYRYEGSSVGGVDVYQDLHAFELPGVPHAPHRPATRGR